MTGGQFSETFSVSIGGILSYLNGGASVPTTQTPTVPGQTLQFGTATGQMSVELNQLRTLGPGASETINLYDGSLLDIFSLPAVFRYVRNFTVFISLGGDSSGLTWGGGASNPTTLFMGGTLPTKTLYPSGPPDCSGSPAGVAITSSSYSVKFTNNGVVPVTYGIIIAGASGVSGSPMGMLLTMLYP